MLEFSTPDIIMTTSQHLSLGSWICKEEKINGNTFFWDLQSLHSVEQTGSSLHKSHTQSIALQKFQEVGGIDWKVEHSTDCWKLITEQGSQTWVQYEQSQTLAFCQPILKNNSHHKSNCRKDYPRLVLINFRGDQIMTTSLSTPTEKLPFNSILHAFYFQEFPHKSQYLSSNQGVLINFLYILKTNVCKYHRINHL